MGRFANKARRHADMIKHYHDNAGIAGYSQAEPHHQQLGNLLVRAHKSKNDQNDIVIIQLLLETADEQMKEMKMI